ncbi:PEP-CTERM sorting domain-containing protein [Nitrospira sp. NS4]|uniref:PEP-CTERM sorting domain-containing protein n=1 Tax=Nitrospira sp. NS4 TaxID=3414498 RepID=UPI003C2C2729
MKTSVVLMLCAALVVAEALITEPANAKSDARENIPNVGSSLETVRLNPAPTFSDRYLDPQSFHADGGKSGFASGMAQQGQLSSSEHRGSSSVPEPSTLILLGVGFAGVAVWRFRQPKASAA